MDMLGKDVKCWQSMQLHKWLKWNLVKYQWPMLFDWKYFRRTKLVGLNRWNKCKKDCWDLLQYKLCTQAKNHHQNIQLNRDKYCSQDISWDLFHMLSKTFDFLEEYNYSKHNSMGYMLEQSYCNNNKMHMHFGTYLMWD